MAQRLPFFNGPGGASEADDAGLVAAGTESSAAPDLRSAGVPDEAIHRAPTPFVWQHGRRLLLLDDEPRGWVMAELRFDVERCRYVEVRRATYRWTREAVGAVLSRALASGDDAAEDSARYLNQWLSRYYGIVLYSEPPPSSGDDGGAPPE
jgi:hypothetical protein